MVKEKDLLEISLDKPCYFPGDHVEGLVLLNLIHDGVIQDMILEIKGEEHSVIPRGKHTSTETKTIVSGFISLNDGLKSLEAGIYHFPFEFRLPDGIPGSVSRKIYSYGYISYELSTSLHVQGRSHLKISKEIQVLERPKNTEISSIAVHSERNIPRFCCCGSSGTVSMLMKMDKDAYFVGDTITSEISIDNKEGRVTIRGFKLLLIESFWSKARSDAITKTSEKWKIKIDEKIPPGKEFRKVLSFSIPDGVMAASSGKIHILKHFIKLNLNTGRICKTSDDITVQIYKSDKGQESHSLSIESDHKHGLRPTVFQKLSIVDPMAYPTENEEESDHSSSKNIEKGI